MNIKMSQNHSTAYLETIDRLTAATASTEAAVLRYLSGNPWAAVGPADSEQQNNNNNNMKNASDQGSSDITSSSSFPSLRDVLEKHPPAHISQRYAAARAAAAAATAAATSSGDKNNADNAWQRVQSLHAKLKLLRRRTGVDLFADNFCPSVQQGGDHSAAGDDEEEEEEQAAEESEEDKDELSYSSGDSSTALDNSEEEDSDAEEALRDAQEGFKSLRTCASRHGPRVSELQRTLDALVKKLRLILDDPTVTSRIVELLTYHPTYVPRDEKEEIQVWQRWAPRRAADADGDTVTRENRTKTLSDVNCLAHANKLRYTQLMARWQTVRQQYEQVVSQVNQNVCAGMLQLDMVEERLLQKQAGTTPY